MRKQTQRRKKRGGNVKREHLSRNDENVHVANATYEPNRREHIHNAASRSEEHDPRNGHGQLREKD